MTGKTTGLKDFSVPSDSRKFMIVKIILSCLLQEAYWKGSKFDNRELIGTA
jgi:hypothetical protein